jgi:hypothetical protein
MEIHWRDSAMCPTEEQYRIMVLRSKLPHAEYPFDGQKVGRL